MTAVGTSKLCGKSKCFTYSAVCESGYCRTCCLEAHAHWKYHAPPAASPVAAQAPLYAPTYVPIEQETAPALGTLSEQSEAEVLPIEGKTTVVYSSDNGGYWG